MAEDLPSLLPVALADAEQAEARVLAWLRERGAGGAVVALSGGADSALLVSLAAEALGATRVLAVTSRSDSLPPGELEAARGQASEAGVEHVVLSGHETDLQAFRQNAPDRCFHCKDSLYGDLARLAAERGLGLLLDGTNADDLDGHRPGYAAGLKHGVQSPLLACGVTKTVVRALSRRRGLSSWEKPAEACLSSRFPYGTQVTPEALLRVAAAEAVLKAHGFHQVRVRVHDPIARLEVPLEDLERLAQRAVREHVVAGLRALGFLYVALDLEGLRSGSLNLPLRPAPRV